MEELTKAERKFKEMKASYHTSHLPPSLGADSHGALRITLDKWQLDDSSTGIHTMWLCESSAGMHSILDQVGPDDIGDGTMVAVFTTEELALNAY
jgi:hypothetical protein